LLSFRELKKLHRFRVTPLCSARGQKGMQCSADGAQIVTRIDVQKSFPNQSFDLDLAQLDPDSGHSIVSVKRWQARRSISSRNFAPGLIKSKA